MTEKDLTKIMNIACACENEITKNYENIIKMNEQMDNSRGAHLAFWGRADKKEGVWILYNAIIKEFSKK